MQDKKIIIYAVIALLLIAGLVYFLVSVVSGPGNGGNGGGGGPGTSTSTATSTSPRPKTVLPVPSGTVVPGVNSTTSPDVAKPTSVKPLGGGGLSSRTFSVSVNKDVVTPQEVDMYVLDDVKITFSAVDKDYTFTQPDLGLTWTVPRGGSKMVPMQFANVGKFIYYCASCGGPSKGPVGYFVVVPK